MENRTNKQIVSYIPRNDQTIIIGKSVIHFQQYDKGMLVLMCGVGKTLISLWITQELNSNTILIGVPNKLLLKQWEEVICVLFQSVPYLIVSGGIDTENIMRFLENNQKKCGEPPWAGAEGPPSIFVDAFLEFAWGGQAPPLHFLMHHRYISPWGGWGGGIYQRYIGEISPSLLSPCNISYK